MLSYHIYVKDEFRIDKTASLNFDPLLVFTRSEFLLGIAMIVVVQIAMIGIYMYINFYFFLRQLWYFCGNCGWYCDNCG